MYVHQSVLFATVISVLTSVSSAQQRHDRVIIGDERYIRTETRVSGGPRNHVYENGVTVEAERVAYVYAASGTNGVSLHYRGFDDWGIPFFNDQDTGYVGSEYSIALVGDRIWILWYAGTANGGWFYQIMDSTTGQPLSPPTSFRATGGAEGTGTSIRCATNGEMLAVAVAAGSNVYLYRFYSDGTPVSPHTPISAIPNRPEGLPSVALLPDLSVVVGFALYTYPFGRVPTLALVNADGVLQRTITVTQQDMLHMNVCALNDGTLLAAYQIEGQWFNPRVRKYSANLDPIGDPIPVEGHDRFFFAANGNGRFAVLLGDGRGEIWFRLYEPDGTPRNDGIPVQIENPPQGFVNTVSVPVVYEDDGTVWFAWTGYWPPGYVMMTSLRPYLPGDMNRDGLLNNFDIDPFVFALSNLPAYAAQYDIPQDAAVIIGDINEDGFLNNFDIDPFVMLLAGE